MCSSPNVSNCDGLQRWFLQGMLYRLTVSCRFGIISMWTLQRTWMNRLSTLVYIPILVLMGPLIESNLYLYILLFHGRRWAAVATVQMAVFSLSAMAPLWHSGIRVIWVWLLYSPILLLLMWYACLVLYHLLDHLFVLLPIEYLPLVCDWTIPLRLWSAVQANLVVCQHSCYLCSFEL